MSEGYAEGEEGRIVSLDALNAKVDKLTEAVSRLLPGTGGQDTAGEEPATSPAGRPATIEEQVQAELDRRDAEAKARQDAEAEKSERQQIKETLARLTEKPPEPPVRRSTKLLGWG